MKYSIKKDAKPKETVAKIQNILSELEIKTITEITGYGNNHHSVRVYLEDKDHIGVNGKGTSEINALASGYAEFMERLQTQYLFPFEGEKYYLEVDEKIYSNKKEKNIIAKNELSKIKVDLINFLKYILRIPKEKREQLDFSDIYVPFVSYKKRTLENLSIFLLNTIQGTNGLAAGNTYEEACTQALSEIIERHCMKQAYISEINFPIIPKKYYEKYETIRNLIKEIENQNYKVTIKDASLNKGFPTICAVFEDLKYPKNGVCAKFGTHLYFPVALERTLSEFMQGFEKIKEERPKQKIECLKNGVKLDKILCECFTKTTFLKKNNKHIQNIISSKQDYNFNKGIWLYDKKLNNKEIFNHLAKNILRYTNDIYIRNYSFLNFPTVRIYVPKFSSPYILNYEFFKNWEELLRLMALLDEDKEMNDSNLKEIAQASKFICEYCSNKIERVIVFGQLRAKYFLFYYSLALKNKKTIKKYLNKIIAELSFEQEDFATNKNLRLYQAYNKFFKLKNQKKSDEQIKEKIEKQYGIEIYDDIKRMIDAFNLDVLRQYIKHPKFDDEKDIEKYSKILYEKYTSNPPNQNEIIEIIGQKITLKEKIRKLFYEIQYKKRCETRRNNL